MSRGFINPYELSGRPVATGYGGNTTRTPEEFRRERADKLPLRKPTIVTIERQPLPSHERLVGSNEGRAERGRSVLRPVQLWEHLPRVRSKAVQSPAVLRRRSLPQRFLPTVPDHDPHSRTSRPPHRLRDRQS